MRRMKVLKNGVNGDEFSGRRQRVNGSLYH
jgi:hypothetical protein